MDKIIDKDKAISASQRSEDFWSTIDGAKLAKVGRLDKDMDLVGPRKKSLLENLNGRSQEGDMQPYDDDDDQDPEYDSPHGSVWIVSVDYAGRVTVLETPNIHPGFLDNGPEAEYLGLPPDVDDMDPGVYRWTCSYHTHLDWESGHVDDWDFEIEESELLWSPNND